MTKSSAWASCLCLIVVFLAMPARSQPTPFRSIYGVVVTDKNVDKLPAMQQVREALDGFGIKFQVFKDVSVEPKDVSVKKAIAFSRPIQPDLFLAVGGMCKEKWRNYDG